MPGPDDILEKIPKKTPIWAIGLTTLLVAATTSFVTVYLIAREDIKHHLIWTEQIKEKVVDNENEKEVKALDSVLKIVNTNMLHIAETDKALALSQLTAGNLAVRVSDLESAVNRLKGSLSSCEQSLAECLKKK